MARRLDRRVQRTRKLLRESMMALILEEGYDAISIQDITDKANLGRATFYLHFKDKDEVLSSARLKKTIHNPSYRLNSSPTTLLVPFWQPSIGGSIMTSLTMLSKWQACFKRSAS